MLIDTHCHLHDREFFSEEQAGEMLKRAQENGVKKIVCIGTDPEDSMAAREFAAKHPNVYWTYGIHPEETNPSRHASSHPSLRGSSLTRSPLVAKCLEDFVSSSLNPPVAIGEVGLDYHSEGYNREAQIKLFEEMLQLADDNDLPVSFHVRNAFEDFFAVVANFPKTRGVLHSFTDSKKTLRKILETTDFYVGVNGLATYSTLPTPPLKRTLLETDAPFLTPTPFRGIINEPGYVRAVAEWLSEKLGVNFETIEKVTTENARRLFRFQDTDVCQK